MTVSSTLERTAASVRPPGVAVLEPPQEWGVGEDVSVGTFADLDPAQLLDELEKHERLSAWLVARGVAIAEQLARTREEEAIDRLDARNPEASSRERTLVRAEARAAIEDEIALATGVSFTVARARTRLAVDEPRRGLPIRHALAAGQLSWQRAQHILQRTEDVPASAMRDLVHVLVAPHPARSDHGQGGLLVPQQVFTARLRYQLAKILTPTQAHEGNLRARDTMTIVDSQHGTGELRVTGHAARIVGAHDRVDLIARHLRRGGDSRSLRQLRSDITLDLVLYGQIPTAAGGAAPVGSSPAGEPGRADDTTPIVSTAATDGPTASHLLTDLLGDTGGAGRRTVDTPWPSPEGPTIDPAAFGGALPPARVDVVVPMSVLLGASDEPGMLTCGDTQEWLAARYVRDIAFTAGSTWRRLVTDPLTGHLRDLTVAGYAVTGELRERVLARDRISRAPGRVRPARWCDTDHDLDFALGGPSSESNVSAKDRRGHNHKTRRTWRSVREPGVDGEILWITPTGRTYATTPWDHHDPDPPDPDRLRATFEKNRRHPTPARPDVDGLFHHDRSSRYVHHLALLADDHLHANDVIDAARHREPPADPSRDDGDDTPLPPATRRPDPSEMPSPPSRPSSHWNREDPGPPPF